MKRLNTEKQLSDKQARTETWRKTKNEQTDKRFTNYKETQIIKTLDRKEYQKKERNTQTS